MGFVIPDPPSPPPDFKRWPQPERERWLRQEQKRYEEFLDRVERDNRISLWYGIFLIAACFAMTLAYLLTR